MSALASRRFAAVLALESATLAVFATLHLSGALHVGSGGDGAGVPEALICLVLLGGALALVRSPTAVGRRAALSAVAFAIFGFLVGLTFTLGSGNAIDLGYHLVMVPVLIATAGWVALEPPGPVHSAHPGPVHNARPGPVHNARPGPVHNAQNPS
jgi:hypothetical protein